MPVAAIIGCGSIGARHLEALQAARLDSIWVVEPNDRARLAAAGHIHRAAGANRVSIVASLECLPSSVDLAVIATSSVERRAALEGLLERTSVGAVVLEKFLFPSLQDYAAVLDTLTRSDVAAWVNCPRRVWAGYRDARTVFTGRTDVVMRHAGSAWGLASNAVHLLDTYVFVTGTPIVALSAHRLDGAAAAKRAGYTEVFGTLSGRTAEGSGSIELTCYREGALPRMTEFVCPDARLLIDEAAGRASWTRASETRERDFPVLPVSAMGAVFDEILEQGTCGLPTLEQSVPVHQMVLRAVGSYLGVDLEAGQPCRIT